LAAHDRVGRVEGSWEPLNPGYRAIR